MRLSSVGQLAELISQRVPCRLVGDPGVEVGPGVVRDSREVSAGDLFVALAGEHVDGHDFAAAAAAAGASAVLAQRVTDAAVPHLIVADSVQGLGALAGALVRQQIAETGLQTFAVTGSSGKTSTKDLLSQILADAGSTISPVGSYNNEIGVPLTACQIDDQTKYLVSEMGARVVGDVAWLCSIVPPQFSAVLNVGVAHLGEFGSQQAIAQAKGEIVEALGPDGWALLNADDPLVMGMRGRTQGHVGLFCVEPDNLPDAELVVAARGLRPDDLNRYSFDLQVCRAGAQPQTHHVSLRLLGRVQVLDAAAAAAMAVAAGVDPAQVAASLSRATPRSRWRMELVELANGAAVINDAYNANPASVHAGLRTLAAIGRRRKATSPQARTIAVLGDMLELGADSARLHHQCGELAASLGIDELYVIGDFAKDLLAGYQGGTGLRANRDNVAAQLSLTSGDVVLIKASRGLGLESIANDLASAYGAGGEDRSA